MRGGNQCEYLTIVVAAFKILVKMGHKLLIKNSALGRSLGEQEEIKVAERGLLLVKRGIFTGDKVTWSV